MVPDTVSLLTNRQNCVMLLDVNCIESFLLFRVMEIHRICEVTATPDTEGAYLSE